MAPTSPAESTQPLSRVQAEVRLGKQRYRPECASCRRSFPSCSRCKHPRYTAHRCGGSCLAMAPCCRSGTASRDRLRPS
jgi:hypothetical protein